MGETPDQIERHIYEKRSELGENIHELQEKVKTAVDWRAQFDQRPLLMLGLAFGGGVFVSMLFNGKGSRDSRLRNRWRRESSRSEHGSNVSRSDDWQDKADSTWNNIRAAVLAVAGSRIGSLIEEVLPGFQEQFKRRQQENSPSQERRGSSRHNGPESTWRRTASGETDYMPQS
jgi:hypothetical protein